MVQVVLIDQTQEIDTTFLHKAAIALNSQATKDLPAYWSGISASVSWAPCLDALPHGAWPVFLARDIPSGEGGFHLDNNNQPFAKVAVSHSDNSWTIDASHEIIEMLVDPYGNRMHSSQAIGISGDDVIDISGLFNYLIEACDPCEASKFSYDIFGVAVSDFITPHFYDSSVRTNTQYSFGGNITRPRQILPGGYISFVLPDGSWNQILWIDPSKPPVYNRISAAKNIKSLRLAFHSAMGKKLDKEKHKQRRNDDGLPDAMKIRLYNIQSGNYTKHRRDHLKSWYDL